ncbi:DUF7311 family protein [Halomarina litorea]|uniref:DUF7311 family protein n=1 Tax=Halomarina litorea TaxID=2961595 RepID=UPI0020C4B3DA|nr:hypothetical protein [Halomarina sp. BCD28]
MLRVVLSVLLAAALVGASIPAVDEARTAAGDAAGERAAARLVDAAAALHDRSDPGGRRPLTLSLPERSWTADGVELRVETGGVRWRVREGEWSHRRASVPLVVPEGPVVVSGAATVELELALERRAGDPVVVVRRGFT